MIVAPASNPSKVAWAHDGSLTCVTVTCVPLPFKEGYEEDGYEDDNANQEEKRNPEENMDRDDNEPPRRVKYPAM